jgi:hypothetical protein
LDNTSNHYANVSIDQPRLLNLSEPCIERGAIADSLRQNWLAEAKQKTKKHRRYPYNNGGFCLKTFELYHNPLKHEQWRLDKNSLSNDRSGFIFF